MRMTREEWALRIAEVVAMRATCVRRRVGCVLTDKHGRILATGYNGVATGLPHCTEGHPCKGANAKTGEDLDNCEAIHAEQNALLQCQDTQRIHTCYVTVSPCITCTKLLLNTSCRRIVFIEMYGGEPCPRELWKRSDDRRLWFSERLRTEVQHVKQGGERPPAPSDHDDNPEIPDYGNLTYWRC